MKNLNLMKCILGISFVSIIFAVVGFFFTFMNLLGVMSGAGVGDWAELFFWFMIIGFGLFLITYLFKEVREFWKSI